MLRFLNYPIGCMVHIGFTRLIEVFFWQNLADEIYLFMKWPYDSYFKAVSANRIFTNSHKHEGFLNYIYVSSGY